MSRPRDGKGRRPPTDNVGVCELPDERCLLQAIDAGAWS